MPLRLRRGTNTDRLTVTPLEGELVYTTDTKLVYIGDGTTLGGNLVGPSTYSGALNGNLNLNGYDVFGTGNINIAGNITGTNLDINGNAVVNGNLTVDGNTVVQGTVEAAAFQGSLYSSNSTQVIDDAGHIYSSILYGTYSGTSVYVQSATQNARTQVFVNSDIESSTLKLRRTETTLIAVGSAPAYTTSPILGQIQFESNDTQGALSKTLIQGSKGYFRVLHANASNAFVEENQIKLTIDGFFGIGNSSPEHRLDVKGDAKISSNLRVLGGINGDLVGSVFADDSTVIVDAVNFKVVGNIETASLRTSESSIVLGDTAGGGNYTVSVGYAAGNTNQGDLAVSIGSNAGELNQSQGAVAIGRDAGYSAQGTQSVAIGQEAGTSNQGINAIAIGYRAGYNNQTAGSIVINASGTALNSTTTGFYVNPIRNDTSTGNVLQYDTSTKEITYSSSIKGDLTGSVFADDSTVIVDAINSTITAGGFVQFGSYTKTDRDGITAANGMVLYNTTSNRFQGYQNGAWINLDDGTADP